MTSEKDSPEPGGSSGDDHATRAAREAADAQARLDQLRGEGGGALGGRELSRRLGLRRREEPVEDEDAPPLDWRMTPLNVAIQLLAIIAFVGALWFMIDLMLSGFGELFS